MTNVCVTTDASFHERFGLAGWASWIAIEGDHHPTLVSGYFQASDSVEAETRALAHGVCAALELLTGCETITITARSDNMHAVGVLSGVRFMDPLRQGDMEACRQTQTRVSLAGAHLVVIHAGDGPELRWCDLSARAAAQLARGLERPRAS